MAEAVSGFFRAEEVAGIAHKGAESEQRWV